MDRNDLIETLAGIEHQRWADWQKYLHSVGLRVTEANIGESAFYGTLLDAALQPGALVLPAERVEGWERQILMPYAQLSEAEKESDREQVMRYRPVLVEFVAAWLDDQEWLTNDRDLDALIKAWREAMT